MKTITTTIALSFFALAFAQHDHSEVDHLFEDKSLKKFQEDLNFSDEDYANQVKLEYVDDKYNTFCQVYFSKFDNDELILEGEFNAEYDTLVSTVSKEIAGLNQSGTLSGVLKMPNGPCVNMDFENGDLTGWTLTRGNVTGAVPYSYGGEYGVGPGPYHQVFGGGVDPVVGIPRVNPDGGNFSVRLGNGANSGAQAARMSQTFLVDATNFMFTYSYAVVFQSPSGHSMNEMPYFAVRVYDSSGASIPCGEYSAYASGGAPGYTSVGSGWSPVLYKDWETVFTNLSPYIGQNVTIEFTSGDCSLSGHYGYAYVDASCGAGEITATQPTICTGEQTTLTAPSGLSAYLWSTGDTTQSITVSAGGTYSCDLIPYQGAACGLTLDITINEYPVPTAHFSTDANTICEGESIEFTDLSTIPNPGAITGYQWDFGDGVTTPISNGAISGISNTTGSYTSPVHTYSTAGNYTVELYIESSDGCSDTFSLSVTVNGTPVVVAGVDQEVCDGEAVTLNGSGAVSYTWDNGITDGIAFTPSVGTTTYTVTGTDANGCENTDQVDVIVNPLPNVDAGLDQEVCDGETVTLNGSGAVSYTWDNGITDGVAFTPSVGTTTYTVTGTDANGCENTDQVDVIVNPLPNVDAGLDQEVCDGETVTLNGSGAVSYTWDNGITDGVAFTPSVGTTTYTVIGTDANGCENTDQVDIIVNPLPNVDAGLDQEVCDGETVTLNGSGAVSYTWDNGITDGVAFTPSVGTTTYTVTGTDVNGCENTDQVDVIVNPLPNVDAGLDQEVCDGETVILNGSGAVSYTWDNGVTNGVAFTPSVGTTTYTVIGTDANGCENTDQVDIIVNPLPNVDAGLDQEVCDGETVSLNGSGAVSYTWDNGITDGVAFTPSVGTTTYTVTGTDANGCENTDQVDVIVNPLSNVDAGLDQEVCDGETVALNGSGAVSYTWDNGITDGVAFTPSVGTTTYTVTGTDANGCENTDQVDVIVNPLPNVDAGLDQEVCDGEIVTLNGSGAVSYTWDNGVTDGVAFTPSVGTTTYTVIGTDANGCENTDQVDVIVNPLPNVDAGLDQEVCDGETVTLNGSGAVSYTWDNGVTDGVAFTPSVGTTTYTVTGTDANGCENTDQVDVIVNPLPNVDAGLDQEVCDGETVTLNASGTIGYVWNNGVVDGVAFTPLVGTTTYTVTGTDAKGCNNLDQVDVIVNPLPIVNAGADLNVCEGTPITLSAMGTCMCNVSWSGGIVDSVAFIQPIGQMTYVVTDWFSTTGCSASDTVIVEVLENPIVSAPDIVICEGEGVTLSGEGAFEYAWTDGVVNNEEFFPSESMSCIVTGTASNGCTAQATSTITVHSAPRANFSILNLSLTTVDPTTGFDNLSMGGNSFTWDFGDGSPMNYEFEPTHTFPQDGSGEYAITLTVESENGCSDEITKYVHVFQDYTIYVPNTFTPDANGVNEVFKPVMEGFDKDEYTMYIFNRWGNLIFETHNMEVGWDGKFSQKEFTAQDGVYTWKIIAKIKDSPDTKIFVGHVSILK